MSAPPGLRLDSYLRRIAYGGPFEPTRSALEGLHLAHASHVPFENLDVLWKRTVRLDLDSLQLKLVDSGRGGYCFEQNLLFAAVLEAAGFAVRRLAARVRVRTTALLPRTHMLLLVEAQGRTWLCDVGFGADGPLLPVPFGGGEEVRQFSWSYRVGEEEEGVRVLQLLRNGAWADQYAFTLEPQHLVDFEVANYWTSTHPTSRFTTSLTAQLPTPKVRKALRNREWFEDRGAGATSRLVPDEDELRGLLTREIGLRLPEGLPIPVPRET